jgi:beta-glucanase (GH16 family)
MSDQPTSETVSGPRRHRRPSRRPGAWAGGALAVVLTIAAVAAGLTHLRGGRTAETEAAVTARTAPAVAPSTGGAVPVPVAPARTPGKKAVRTSAPARTTATAKATAPAGFRLTWMDSFDGRAGTGLDRHTYQYDTGQGTFGTGEIETMTDSTANVFHDGHGHLVVRARHSGSDPRQGWTSGRFETKAESFGAAPGGVVRMEARLQQPAVTTGNGAGYWPAFWMLGNGLRHGGQWPGIGEVDILEDINGRSSVFGTLHCGSNPGGPCHESTGIGSGEKACGGCQSGFHTYAVEIDRSRSPERIRWFLDGTNYFTLDQSRVDATTWTKAVDHSFFIIFDLAIGGGFPDAFGGGPNDKTVSGAQMTIDYVAVYNKR